ncbi:hypothetical protein HK100_003799 [Physocladia obscura]|uniref:BHLH domain-containing protein n=1 Tax=Physocladia obscura TaxID=109957 RepID=A0AAD5X959_9FUNG|nr:hypothetical protein HK100_003799 [Physocladia obscura]
MSFQNLLSTNIPFMMLPPRPPFDAAPAEYSYNYGLVSGSNSGSSIGGITGDAELFNFHELFGDPTSTDYENTNGNNSSEEEALLSSEDQSIFAQFLDTLGGSTLTPSPSLASAGIAGIANSQLSSLMLSFPQGLFGQPLSFTSMPASPFGLAPLFNQNQQQNQIQHIQQNQPQVVRKRSVEGLRPQSQLRLSSFSNMGAVGMLGGSYRNRDRDTDRDMREMGDTRDMRVTYEQCEREREREFKHETGHESMTIPMGETEVAAQAAVNESASASLLASSLPKRLKSSPSSRAFSLLAPAFYHQQNAQAPSLFTPTSFNPANLQGLTNNNNNDFKSSLYSFSFIPSLSTNGSSSSNTNTPHFSLIPQHTQQLHLNLHQELNHSQQHHQSQKLENYSNSILQNHLHPDLDLISNHPSAAISTAQLLPPSPIIHTSSSTTATVAAPTPAPKKRGRKPKDALLAVSKTASAMALTVTMPSSATVTISSVTAKNSKSLLTPSEKKTNHIQAEQRRRAQIREALKELTVLVPGLRPPIEGDCSIEGSSRVQILDGARMFVTLLMEKNEGLKAQLM